MLQKCVAELTIAVEYMAGAKVANEAIWLDCLLTEMGFMHDTRNLLSDSQSTSCSKPHDEQSSNSHQHRVSLYQTNDI